MILPIYAYGKAVLKEKAEPVPLDYPDLHKLIADMYETMYNANGVGLAAPQVGKSLRLFIVDTREMKNAPEFPDEDLKTFKKVFINPIILQSEGEPWGYEEGCLSIPYVRDIVHRQPTITLQYQDEHGNTFMEQFTGLKARVIQHEYDHIEGILFIDHLSPLRKQILRPKITKILNGKVETDYPMVFK